jgi:hypothetical protein
MTRRSILTPESRIFTMGSCFAAELRKALTRKGLRVYPDYVSVEFDREQQVFNHIPERDSVEHYDTFSIRQEFESAFGIWPRRDDCFWEVTGKPVNKILRSEVVYQEPCRKLIYARSRELLSDLSGKIDAVMKAGVEQADILVITLGLTEVWQHKLTGRYLCRPPHSGFGGRPDLATFRQSTFVENYENMKVTLDMILQHYPNKKIVMTVSPVPLEATYSAVDVATANVESKSILRAVAGQICREYSANVSYFPSYEMATVLPGPVFMEDKRHVLPEFADKVINGFMQVFT